MKDQIWLPIFGHFLKFFFIYLFMSFIFDKLAPPPLAVLFI